MSKAMSEAAAQHAEACLGIPLDGLQMFKGSPSFYDPGAIVRRSHPQAYARGAMTFGMGVLAGREKGFQHLEILLGLFIGGKMAALFEEHDLSARNGVRHAPRGER